LLCYSYATRIRNFKRLRPAVVKICCFLVECGLNMYCRMSFDSILLILFLCCSVIAMLRVYKFSKGCAQPLWRYAIFGRIWAEHLSHVLQRRYFFFITKKKKKTYIVMVVVIVIRAYRAVPPRARHRLLPQSHVWQKSMSGLAFTSNK
jgi:hypothetical protein